MPVTASLASVLTALRKERPEPQVSLKSGAAYQYRRYPYCAMRIRLKLPAEAAYTSLPGSALLFGVSFSAASALPRDAAAGRGALTLDPRRVFLQSGCIPHTAGAEEQKNRREKSCCLHRLLPLRLKAAAVRELKDATLARLLILNLGSAPEPRG